MWLHKNQAKHTTMRHHIPVCFLTKQMHAKQLTSQNQNGWRRSLGSRSLNKSIKKIACKARLTFSNCSAGASQLTTNNKLTHILKTWNQTKRPAEKPRNGTQSWNQRRHNTETDDATMSQPTRSQHDYGSNDTMQQMRPRCGQRNRKQCMTNTKEGLASAHTWHTAQVSKHSKQKPENNPNINLKHNLNTHATTLTK